MARSQEYTAKQMIEAAEATGGNKAAAGKRLGCTRQTVENYCKRYTTVDEAFKEQRKVMLDYAQAGLRHHLGQMAPWAIKFTLQTLGKEEGWSQKIETEQSGEIKIKVVRE